MVLFFFHSKRIERIVIYSVFGFLCITIKQELLAQWLIHAFSPSLSSLSSTKGNISSKLFKCPSLTSTSHDASSWQLCLWNSITNRPIQNWHFTKSSTHWNFYKNAVNFLFWHIWTLQKSKNKWPKKQLLEWYKPVISEK